jgi:hypothetical protein
MTVSELYSESPAMPREAAVNRRLGRTATRDGFALQRRRPKLNADASGICIPAEWGAMRMLLDGVVKEHAGV